MFYSIFLCSGKSDSFIKEPTIKSREKSLAGQNNEWRALEYKEWWNFLHTDLLTFVIVKKKTLITWKHGLLKINFPVSEETNGFLILFDSLIQNQNILIFCTVYVVIVPSV